VASDADSTADASAIVSQVRDIFGADGVEARRSAEADARRLLDQTAGRMSEEQVVELGSLFNRDLARGVPRRDRFLPAFMGATIQRLARRVDLVNEWTARLWDRDESAAMVALDEVLKDRAALPGGGRSYPTMLMYLRDSGRFAVWMDALERGLRAASDYPGATRAEGAEGYLRFCEAALEFARSYELELELTDAVLAEAARRAAKRKAPGPAPGPDSFPTLGPEAFTCLASLRDGGSEWMQANRSVYRVSLRRPFREVMQAVADSYVAPLDPLLITEVKAGKVLASIRKRFPDEEGEYWGYYWGAFSRYRKQEDVQLFVSIYTDKLRYGLWLGSAPRAVRDTLRNAIADGGEGILGALPPEVRALRWEREEHEDPMRVESVQELAIWAEGDQPVLAKQILPDDPLIGSPRLVDDIGKILQALYPLAAVAWGERIVQPPDGDGDGDEIEEEEYSLADLAADTHLPIEDLEEWTGLLSGSKRQALLYGPPGTGKTFVAERMARFLAGEKGERLTVQFHPSYSYEDFLEGLRPVTEDGKMRYEVRPGTFALLCERARVDPDHTYVLVIDEINRTDLGSVLGELMLLLEYRGKVVELPYSHRRFSVPRNLVVLATMNTADRSLALVDFALRRRFHAIQLLPSREVLEGWLLAERSDRTQLTVRFFDLVQGRVGSSAFAPGHSYWMAEDLSAAGLQRIWRYEIRPYLEEYWFEHPARLAELEGEVGELLAEEA
jgi:hypothetical protein